MDVETAVFGNYMCLVCGSSYIYTFIYSRSTNKYFSWKHAHIPSLCFVLYHLSLAVAVFIHLIVVIKLYLNSGFRLA